jgi:2-oxoglutarate/2-oxoacid ferredoxin oxidoreductase subunit beta
MDSLLNADRPAVFCPGCSHDKVMRASTYQKDLVDRLKAAITFDGFSLVDIWGICTGRYTRRNKLTPKMVDADLARMPALPDYRALNDRPEYGQAYRKETAALGKVEDPVQTSASCKAPQAGRQEIVILGSAGQRIITAGELLCLAGASAGCHVTQKNDYPITVMKGHSVSEVILSDSPIDYTGIEDPSVVIALAPEGVYRRKKMLTILSPGCTIIKAAGVDLPETRASVLEIDFKAKKVKSTDWALAALTVLARQNKALSLEMLTVALKLRFKPKVLQIAQTVMEKVTL